MELITHIGVGIIFTLMILAAHVADYYQENKDESDVGTEQDRRN